MHQLRMWTVALAALTFVSQSCTCNPPKIQQTNQCLEVAGSQADHPNACVDTTECGEHFNCRAPDKENPDLKCCLFADRQCTTEADCCQGQTCPSDRKKCFDKFIECTKDSECGDTGDKFCEQYTDTYGSSSRCRFKACSDVGGCPDGQVCFQGECMVNLPCSGACDPGKACVPSIDRCQDYADPTGRPTAACPMSCNAGFIGTFKNNRNLWDSCDLAAAVCVCAELPGLRSEDLGRFSAVAAEPGVGVIASMYDGQYGDLVVSRFDLTGKKLSTDYVDGVPTGVAKYGPSGARAGVVEPGDDVGRYTDIVVGGGQAYVSFYDASHGDLRVAIRAADGSWKKHRVDGASGDVGLYTSIALDSDGKPGISYFMRSADASFNVADCPGAAPTVEKRFITALKFARATTANPSSESDWQVKTVACLAKPAPVCDACPVAGASVCADPGGSSAPQCLPVTTGCTGCDPSAEVCVTSNSAPKCLSKFTPPNLTDVPVGVGVFSSLAFDGKEAVIAYMQRTLASTPKAVADGDLYGVRVSATNIAAAPVVLDATGDTGYFPDVKIEPTTKKVAIAFHDFSSKSFKFYYAQNLQTGVTPEVIDRGIEVARPGEQGFVGTDSALIYGGPAGQIWAVYQDATRGDLKLAKRTTTWATSTVSSQGAVGFFADGVFTDGQVYATHARIHSRLVSGEAHLDNSLLLEQIPGN